MFSDVIKRLDKIETDLQQHKVDSWRAEILDFANSCMNKRQHTKEEFDHFLDTHSDYEKYLKENELENGKVEVAYEYVKAIYLRRCEKNDFLNVTAEEDEED